MTDTQAGGPAPEGDGPRFPDPRFIEELARRLAANVPASVRAMQADLERNFEALLGTTFSRLNLVTREEFDVQRRVLERTREKLARLEAALAALEQKGGAPGAGHDQGAGRPVG